MSPWQSPRPWLSQRRGFTLIELLVVVLIIGILAAIALPRLLGQRTRAKNAAAQSAVRHALVAARSYYTQNSESYVGLGPTQLQGYESSLGTSEPVDGQTPGTSANPQNIWIGNGLDNTNPNTVAGGDPNGGNTVVLCSVSRGDTVYCVRDVNGVASYLLSVSVSTSVLSAAGGSYSAGGWSNSTPSAPSTVSVDYLVVGGGGGGSNGLNYGGGGGGGQVKSGTLNLSLGSQSITVGSGGAPQASGGSSSAGGVSSSGGGTSTNESGGASGSGRAGGTGYDGTNFGGGGGGGDSAVGGNVKSGSGGGNGGAGTSSSITGSAVSYGGGGGAAGTNYGSLGGTGVDGGANGGYNTAGYLNGYNAAANRGGGGGGAVNATGGNGGSGVIIIRYLASTGINAAVTGGGAVTTPTIGGVSYKLITFTASGTLSLS